MSKVISFLGTGARISALAALAMTASIGVASAATCSEIENSWPSLYAATCLTDPPPSGNNCPTADAYIIYFTDCCTTSPIEGPAACISTLCSNPVDNALNKVGITCQ